MSNPEDLKRSAERASPQAHESSLPAHGVPPQATGSPPGAALPSAGRPHLTPPPVETEQTLPPAVWGIIAFLVSEGAFFAALIVAYVTFLNRDTTGPTPAEVLSLSLVAITTTCLLSSSFTVHVAEKALHRGAVGRFKLWWAATIGLGAVFLAGTAYEWTGLIRDEGLTISTNLFGTTFYTLVGFHAFHVTAGVMAMLIIFSLAMRRKTAAGHQRAVGPVALYWHFVDGVWIVVFLVVYVIGR